MLITYILIGILTAVVLSSIWIAIDHFIWARHSPKRLNPVEKKLFNGLITLKSTKIWALAIIEWQKAPSDAKFWQLLRSLRDQAKDDIDAMADVIGAELTALLFHPTLKLNDK